jgi:hypothetical protein
MMLRKMATAAIMMPSSFDCRPHLDANRLEEAVIEDWSPLSREIES